MKISRRSFLFGSVSASALVMSAAAARAWSVQDMGPEDGAMLAARCTASAGPHGEHLQKALDLLGKSGIAVPLATAQSCPICGCSIGPG